MSFGPDSQPRAKPFIFWVVYSVDFAEEVGSEKGFSKCTYPYSCCTPFSRIAAGNALTTFCTVKWCILWRRPIASKPSGAPLTTPSTCQRKMKPLNCLEHASYGVFEHWPKMHYFPAPACLARARHDEVPALDRAIFTLRFALKFASNSRCGQTSLNCRFCPAQGM